MAGVGPAPKDPNKRARRNKDGVPSMVLPFIRAEQPPLPRMGSKFRWPARRGAGGRCGRVRAGRVDDGDGLVVPA